MVRARQEHERLPPVLARKKALVVGVANEQSIALSCAQAMRGAGAGIVTTYLSEWAKPHVEPFVTAAVADISTPLDVQDKAQVDAVLARIAERWVNLDILIHSIAFAPRVAVQRRVVNFSRKGYLKAADISCWSFFDMAWRSKSLMKQGGTMIAMTYLGANKVANKYGVMGLIKAALESATRYLATELRPQSILAQAISPGSLATRTTSGIKDFDDLMTRVSARAPARRLVTIGDGSCYLRLSCQQLCCGNNRRDSLY